MCVDVCGYVWVNRLGCHVRWVGGGGQLQQQAQRRAARGRHWGQAVVRTRRIRWFSASQRLTRFSASSSSPSSAAAAAAAEYSRQPAGATGSSDRRVHARRVDGVAELARLGTPAAAGRSALPAMTMAGVARKRRCSMLKANSPRSCRRFGHRICSPPLRPPQSSSWQSGRCAQPVIIIIFKNFMGANPDPGMAYPGIRS